MNSKSFWKIMICVTFISFIMTCILGSDIRWKDIHNINFSWLDTKGILYDISVGIFSSMILVWCIDRIQLKIAADNEYKQHLILYNKINPILTRYYDFYLYLFLATRNIPVENDSGVLESLYFCREEFLTQLKNAEPFYKDGYYGDPIKLKAQLALMASGQVDPGVREMSTSLPWYQCWHIEGTAFYDSIVQIEKDFLSFFPNDLLAIFEELLQLVLSQKNMQNFVEGRDLSDWTTSPSSMPQLPTDFFIDAYKIMDVIRLLEQVMYHIESESNKPLRKRDVQFFNNRNTKPVIGDSCKKSEE